MADIFLDRDASSLLFKKHVLMFGCSNMRATYKDLVWLLNKNVLIDNIHLRKKLEQSFLGDRLVSKSVLTKSRDFVEERIYEKDNVYIEFNFLTRCYGERLQNKMKAIKEGLAIAPDVILINSTLWDLCRWGPNGIEDFKSNLVKLMELFNSCLPKSTLVIWSTALPVNSTMRGGLIIKQIEFMQQSMRFNLMEANQYAKFIVTKYGYDILDLHYYMNLQVSRRSCDGVHFLPLPLRFMTNLFLTHLALTWGIHLPNRSMSLLLEKELELSSVSCPKIISCPETDEIEKLEKELELSIGARSSLIPAPTSSGNNLVPQKTGNVPLKTGNVPLKTANVSLKRSRPPKNKRNKKRKLNRSNQVGYPFQDVPYQWNQPQGNSFNYLNQWNQHQNYDAWSNQPQQQSGFTFFQNNLLYRQVENSFGQQDSFLYNQNVSLTYYYPNQR